jgi:hypothetical protein
MKTFAIEPQEKYQNNKIHLKLVTHQQMHYLLNLEGLNFTLEFT